MTKILALDTSAEACSVALFVDGEVIEDFQRAPREHTRRLMPAVDRLLARQKLHLRDLDALAFGRGPGSFTGLRICMSTVQGLAFGANLPVIPVSTLEALARGAVQRESLSGPWRILAALDARMEQIYWGVFESDGVEIKPGSTEFVSAPFALEQRDELASYPGPLLGVGSGWRYESLSSLKPERIIVNADCHAGDIAEIGAARFLQGDTLSVFEAQPVYLRDEVTWKKRQRLRDRAVD